MDYMVLPWNGADADLYCKGVHGGICHRGGPSVGIFPLNDRRRLSVEYLSDGMEKNECKTYTVSSRSTPIRLRRSRPGSGSTLEARCLRKDWIPRPDISSEESAPPLFPGDS